MTNKQLSIGILILIIAVVMASCSWQINHKQDTYTTEEQRVIAKWKNRTLDKLVYDADKGDAAAMWLIGGYFLAGSHGFPLNTDMAYEYFERSATLGFAPALNDLAQRCIDEQSNSHLALVYGNLVIAFGHKEFLQTYNDLRDQVVADFEDDSGKLTMDVIECLAAKKMARILNNQKDLVNKKARRFKKITDEDYKYDSDFWIDVALDRVEVVDSSEIKGNQDEPYINELHEIFYQSILRTGASEIEAQLPSAVLEKMSDAGYSDSKIKQITKQALFLAKSTHKFICKTEKVAEEIENKLVALDAIEASIK